MAKYKVIRSYIRVNNTLREGDEEKVEYSVTPLALDTLKDARQHLKYIAEHEDMTILNRGLNAEKETVSINEETDIVTTETERLSIIIVA